MDISQLNQKQLFSFLNQTLPFFSFNIFVHILTEPYLSLISQLPLNVKKTSKIYLDGNKRKINDYAVKRLRANYFFGIYYINRLHAKLITIGYPIKYIILGSSNFTSRSFSNHEIIILIENPKKEFANSINHTIEKFESISYSP